MKKNMYTISILSFLLLLCAAPIAQAVPITAGDYITLTNYNALDNAGIMTFEVSQTSSFSNYSIITTFCIQDNVYIWPNSAYTIGNISNTVGPVDLSNHINTPGIGNLNSAVDYLYYRYATGAYDLSSLSNQADFQKLLWSLQGSGPAYSSSGTPWAADLLTYETTASLQNQSWGTEVLNIVGYNSSGTLVDIQNQLYYPVPEPTTMLLLGLGLVGVAGMRKFCK